MSESKRLGWFSRHHFALRRLHSLTGIIPVGVFLCVHLTINSTIVHGDHAFQTAVDGLHLLGKVGLLTAIEIAFIFLPLLFHAVLGVAIWLGGRMNVTAHPYGGNVRYTLQRITGLVTFAFVLYHLWHLHWLGKPFGGGFFDPHHAPATAAEALESTVVRLIYGVGILASVFHLANGVWTFLITWGITIGAPAQRRLGWVCAVFGVLLALTGLVALQGFGAYDWQEPPGGDVPGEEPVMKADATNQLDETLAWNSVTPIE